jgi:hypothetical protein
MQEGIDGRGRHFTSSVIGSGSVRLGRRLCVAEG